MSNVLDILNNSILSNSKILSKPGSLKTIVLAHFVADDVSYTFFQSKCLKLTINVMKYTRLLKVLHRLIQNGVKISKL